jgi:hypothetical protein
MISMELEEMLNDPAKRAALKRVLLSYPGTTEEQADARLDAYELRVEKKREFLDHGMWNAMTEFQLDRLGYPRPPGWKSVFFYPDSFRPRNWYVMLAAAIIASGWFFL